MVIVCYYTPYGLFSAIMGVPMMPWGRKLLSVAEEVTSFDSVPLTVIVGVVAAIVVVVLLALCVCGDRLLFYSCYFSTRSV